MERIGKAYGKMEARADALNAGLDIPNLRFKKSGSQISASVSALISKRQKDISDIRNEVEVICKRRNITLQEVLDADDDTKVETYASKASLTLGGKQERSLIEQLNEDLQVLKYAPVQIRGIERGISTLQRVSRNIETSREFDLTFEEVTALGF